LAAFCGPPDVIPSYLYFIPLRKGIAAFSVLHEWIKENAKSILKERPEVTDYGLWVVTSIWSAVEAAINCWSGTHKSVDVGFNAKVAEIGKVAPKSG
jgi:hypothetical protein